MGASPIFSPHRRIRCPGCGSERLQIPTERDPIDRVTQTPSDNVRRLFIADMRLYRCSVCRLQFYDIGQAAEPAAASPTVIGRTMTITGRMSCRENILVDGEIEGDLEIPAHRLTIGPSGRMRGDVRAAEVVIRASATVTGNIRTPSLTIEEGAFFKGGIETA
jgi:cytoskeletal protein CcmA (bactofilin family)